MGTRSPTASFARSPARFPIFYQRLPQQWRQHSARTSATPIEHDSLPGNGNSHIAALGGVSADPFGSGCKIIVNDGAEAKRQVGLDVHAREHLEHG